MATTGANINESISVTYNESISVTYYVSTTGNDSNPGTSDLPFKTIQKVADIDRD